MPVWRIDSVTEEPHTTLESWAVIALPNGDRHLVGYAVEAREGRVSSCIQGFDPRTLLGKSRSGRVYALRGRPGLGADAEYTWNRWRRLNDADTWEDVSEEVWSEHQQVRAASGSEASP